jgi:nucleolar protein 4
MGGPTTVFVRNLPYTCTDAHLEEAFSEIGPVKESFIIADKGAGGRSKGFGFVHFALAEDAAAAVERSGTFQIAGRGVTIDIAKQKPAAAGGGAARKGGGDKDNAGGGGGGGAEDADAMVPEDTRGKRAVGGGGGGDESDSDSDAPKAKAAPAAPARTSRQALPPRAGATGGGGAPPAVHPALKDAERAARTVAVGGLRLSGEPDGIDPDAALDAARACGGAVEEVVSPAPPDVVAAAKLRHDGCTRGVVLVVFATAAAAKHAVTQLHRTFPGVGKRKQQRLRAQLAEGGAGAAKAAGAGAKGGVGPDAADASVEMIWARQLGGCEGAKPKSWRVIIRNLSFAATDDAIRHACSVAGFVWDLTVPRDFHHKSKVTPDYKPYTLD